MSNNRSLASMSSEQLDRLIQEKSLLRNISQRDAALLSEALQIQCALKEVAQFEEKDNKRILEALQWRAYNLAGQLQELEPTEVFKERFDLIDGLVEIAKADKNARQLELHIKQMEAAIASYKREKQVAKQSSTINRTLSMLKELKDEEETNVEEEKHLKNPLPSEENQEQRSHLISHIKEYVAKLNEMEKKECEAVGKPIVIKHRPINHLDCENLLGLNQYFEQLKLEYDVKKENVKVYESKRSHLIGHIRKCVAKLNEMETKECKAAGKPIVVKHRPVNHLDYETLPGLNKYFEQLKLEYDVKKGNVKVYESNRSALFTPAPRVPGATPSDILLGTEPTFSTLVEAVAASRKPR
jgi:hypothetical protein